jgi:hypothetical protein
LVCGPLAVICYRLAEASDKAPVKKSKKYQTEKAQTEKAFIKEIAKIKALNDKLLN